MYGILSIAPVAASLYNIVNTNAISIVTFSRDKLASSLLLFESVDDCTQTMPRAILGIVNREKLVGSDAAGAEDEPSTKPVYHSSARSIVFRDQIRRASMRARKGENEVDKSLAALALASVEDGEEYADPDKGVIDLTTAAAAAAAASPQVKKVATSSTGFPQPFLNPLPRLELGPNEEFDKLLNSSNEGSELTAAEREVVDRLKNQTGVVKTIKNSEWPVFLQRFLRCQTKVRGRSQMHQDKQVGNGFNSFVTSTSLLPSNGQKMRCFGSTTQYTTGVIFPLPTGFASSKEEDEEVERTETWAWPAGYAAKVRCSMFDEKVALWIAATNLCFLLSETRLSSILTTVVD